MLRRQLPVYSPIRTSALITAFRSGLTGDSSHHDLIVTRLAEEFRARRVALTDSGTSALVLALRMLVGEGKTVALPGYACVDLAAAALYARVRVRLYDIDPATLSPDLDSVLRLLREGVAAVVVAHLYGFPADVPVVTELARAYGAFVIEDAAQGAGGMLRGARLGSFGALTVLSFNRGKGITGGRGGALLAIDPDLNESVAATMTMPIRGGWRDLTVAAAQWVFGRPALYSIPSSIPWLRLGEMVYRPAKEPANMSAAAAAIVRAALPMAEKEIAVRRRNAQTLAAAIRSAKGLEMIRAVDGGRSGYLRFPVRDFGQRGEVRRLGILRGYPRTLMEQEELRLCLQPNAMALAGAEELTRSLFTLPVHSLLTLGDLKHIAAWLASPTGSSNMHQAHQTMT